MYPTLTTRCSELEADSVPCEGCEEGSVVESFVEVSANAGVAGAKESGSNAKAIAKARKQRRHVCPTDVW